MAQVQLELPEESISEIDKWVSEGKFKSRGDAIRTILASYQEKEKTREFYEMLMQRSNEAKENPEILIPLEDLDEV
jgi:Arc/MetJ-type ribon-helix-helix transcriptional regulator